MLNLIVKKLFSQVNSFKYCYQFSYCWLLSMYEKKNKVLSNGFIEYKFILS